MASTKLIVKSKTKGSLAKVFIRYRQGREIDLWAPTEFKMFPEFWNNVSQSFKSRITFTEEFTPIEKDKLESQFRNLKTYILNKVNTNNEISRNILSEYVHEFHYPNGINKKGINLNEYIDCFIEDCESNDRLTEKSTRFATATIKTYKAFRSQFQQYQELKNKKCNYEDITMQFYNDFVKYFNEKNYTPNTIGKHIKVLKYMMRCSRDEDLHNNLEINKRKFKVTSNEVKTIYLSEDELQKIYNLDLSDNPTLEKQRDVFLIGCYTAQRFSDYSKIKKDNINILDDGIKVIELTQQKTNETVVIPIRPELENLLAKYDYTVPNTFEQKVNKGVKEVGKLVEINEPVVIDSYQGGKKVSVTAPKYKLIQTHTARRTGCTNMYLAGIPSIDIMKISGHKTEKEFLKYIRITKKQTAQNLAKHSYFTGKKSNNL